VFSQNRKFFAVSLDKILWPTEKATLRAGWKSSFSSYCNKSPQNGLIKVLPTQWSFVKSLFIFFSYYIPLFTNEGSGASLQYFERFLENPP